jgi:DNA-directed RNA polymerase II subunit RPB1
MGCEYAGRQVLIQNGELLTGTLCKKTLGASGGSLIHIIWMEEGPEAARAFLSQSQYTTNHWLLQHGFSIGIGDTVADAKTMNIISETIAEVWPLILCTCEFTATLCSCSRLSCTT